MQLPLTTNSIVAWYDPAPRFINYANKSNKILSIINRIDGRPCIQTNTALQPGWSATGMGGYPALVFSGSQYLVGNILPNTLLTGLSPTISMTMVISLTSRQTCYAACMCWSNFIHAQGSQFPVEFASDGTIIPFRIDDLDIGLDAVLNAGFYNPNTINVATLSYNSSKMTVRLNGAQVGSALNGTFPSTPASGFTTLDTIVLGGGPNDITPPFGFNLNGSLGEVIIYGGEASTNIESFLFQKYGIPTTLANN